MTEEKKPGRLRRMGRKIRKVTGSTSEWLGGKSIRDNSNMIVNLWQILRQNKQNNYLILHPDRSIDLEKTAFQYGIPLNTLFVRIEQRKQETATKAKLFFLLGICFFFYWLYQLIFYEDWTMGKVLMAGFILIFPFSMLILSMLYAWVNWQIRYLYFGSLNEFLRSGSIMPKSY